MVHVHPIQQPFRHHPWTEDRFAGLFWCSQTMLQPHHLCLANKYPSLWDASYSVCWSVQGKEHPRPEDGVISAPPLEIHEEGIYDRRKKCPSVCKICSFPMTFHLSHLDNHHQLVWDWDELRFLDLLLKQMRQDQLVSPANSSSWLHELCRSHHHLRYGLVGFWSITSTEWCW